MRESAAPGRPHPGLVTTWAAGPATPAPPESLVMDRVFACPECGSMLEVGGLAPGRQVRCMFCHRLLEVPFLPRAEVSGWKRPRFARPRWVPYAWGGLAVVLAAVVLLA